jgi:hypothetical protein
VVRALAGQHPGPPELELFLAEPVAAGAAGTLLLRLGAEERLAASQAAREAHTRVGLREGVDGLHEGAAYPLGGAVEPPPTYTAREFLDI